MKKYECKNCGAELYWDSNGSSLKCEYCGTEYQASEFEFEEAPEAKQDSKEPEQAEEHATATDDSDSSDLVIYKCEHCGAEIVTARSTVATTCAYCGRAISMTDKLVKNFKPDVVIPFSVDESRAREIYMSYAKKRVLVPKDFYTEQTMKKMKGIYVPFWLHSFILDNHSVIYAENITSNRRGDDKIVHHFMYNIMIDSEGEFTDVPTDALKKMDNTLMDALEPFDYAKMEPFNPAFMAGYYAEEYNENSEETIERATSRAKQSMDGEIQASSGIYAVKRTQSSQYHVTVNDSKYAMLPVWLLNVEYKGKDYLYAINGETGKIVGKLPIAAGKLWGIILSVFGGSLVAVALVILLLLVGGVL